jgi:hypothetical protein
MSSNLFFVKKRKWKSIDDYGGYTPQKSLLAKTPNLLPQHLRKVDVQGVLVGVPVIKHLP